MAYVESKTFNEIFEDSTSFKNNYDTSSFHQYYVFPTGGSEPDYLGILFDLLSAQYGDTPVSSKTEWMFKQKVNSIIFKYAPTWVKKLDIQKKLRALSDADLTVGSIAKTTHGYNPSTVPSGPNSGDTSIDTVDDQSLQKITKTQMQGYSELLSLLEEDVTEEFLFKFKPLFMFVMGDF